MMPETGDTAPEGSIDPLDDLLAAAYSPDEPAAAPAPNPPASDARAFERYLVGESSPREGSGSSTAPTTGCSTGKWRSRSCARSSRGDRGLIAPPRLVEEAQIGGQLQHPGIVPVYDLGRCDAHGRPSSR